VPLVPAICTQCGAEINVDNSNEALVCEFCNTPFIVEKAIQKYHIQHANIHTDNLNVFQGDNPASLLYRAQIELEYGQWKKAYDLADQALSKEPKNGDAYLIMLLATRQCSKREDLQLQGEDLAKSVDYAKALRFASPENKKFLESANKAIRKRILAECDSIDHAIAQNVERENELRERIEAQKQELVPLEEAIGKLQAVSNRVHNFLSKKSINCLCYVLGGLLAAGIGMPILTENMYYMPYLLFSLIRNYYAVVIFVLFLCGAALAAFLLHFVGKGIYKSYYSLTDSGSQTFQKILDIQQAKITPIEFEIRKLEHQSLEISKEFQELTNKRLYQESLLSN